MSEGVIELERLSAVLGRICRRYGIAEAYVFGSYARGEADSNSDLDILVIGDETFHAPDVFAIAEELHIAFGKDVDVYELREIDPDTSFCRSVMRERVRVA